MGSAGERRVKKMYMDQTLRAMLENPLIAEIAPDAISKWDLSG